MVVYVQFTILGYLPNNYNMKTQVLLLTTKLQTYSTKLMAIFCSFFLPIVGILILIACSVLHDTITGIWKAKKLKQSCKPIGFSFIYVIYYAFCSKHCCGKLC